MTEPNCRDCLFSDDWKDYLQSGVIVRGWWGMCLLQRNDWNRPTCVNSASCNPSGWNPGCDQFTHWKEGVTA